MIYAIGDIHGELDMLQGLLTLIKNDAESLNISRPRIVILGDLIDRGLNSKGVIDLLLSSDFSTAFDATVLLGNHEDMLLKVLDGDMALLSDWLYWGGAETIESYGVEFGNDSISDVSHNFRKAIPSAHIDFLKSLPLTLKLENWFFVHAGIRPGVPLDRQKKRDLLWIYEEFLEFEGSFGEVIIVHGHAVTESHEVEVFPHRMAIDTGAGYRDGKLSAVRLENGAVAKTMSMK